MRRLLISWGALMLGCAQAGPSDVFRVPDSSRSYRVLTAGDRTRPSGVLFALHSFSSEPEKFGRSFSLPAIARERDWLLVVPEGERDSRGQPFWNATRACCDAERKRPDDVAYLRAVLHDVQQRYRVDPKRVYAFGVSNGGFMAHRWACTPGSELAAVVSIAGVGPGPLDAPCSPTAPVRLLQIHGSHDAIIHYEGGELNGARYPSARASLDPWLRTNGCSHAVTTLERPPFDLTTSRTSWRCTSAPAALWQVVGGGHRMPLGSAFMRSALGFLEGS